MSLEIKIKKINSEAILPHYMHKGDAGMDLFSCENYILGPGERKLFGIGLKIEIPEGYEMQIRPKSGLTLKYGITVLNTPGTIDSSYRGEVGVILINHRDEDYEIKKGEKIAQAVINRVETAEITEVEELSDSSRGEGGFGSTGLTK
jgi:dUTP pyrophosphatase